MYMNSVLIYVKLMGPRLIDVRFMSQQVFLGQVSKQYCAWFTNGILHEAKHVRIKWRVKQVDFATQQL